MKPYAPPFMVLEPAENSPAKHFIAENSGIVGAELPEDTSQLVVSFEGNLYNAENLKEKSQKIMHAADRLRTGYPTVARGIYPKAWFKVVGVYHATE